MAAPDFEKVDRWIDQAAMEIMLSEPGSDRSQFPIRDLLANIAEKSAAAEGYESLHACAAFAQEYVEEIMFSGQPFQAESLAKLTDLASQMKSLREDPSQGFNKPGESAAPAAAAAAPAPAPVAAAPAPAPAPVAAPAPLPANVHVVEDLDEYTTINLANDGDLLREFANESREHLENIEQGVLVLEEHPEDADTLASIFRAFHTFKGGSGFLHLLPVNRLSHELESLLDLARQGKLRITSSVINLILEGGDILKAFLNQLEAQIDCRVPVQPIHVPGKDLIGRVQIIIANPDAVIEKAAPVAKAAAVESAAASDDHAPAAAGGEAKAASGSPAVIKVDTVRFDSLVDLVGELVIAQSLVVQDEDMQAMMKSPRLTRNLSQLSRITNELQKTAMTLRMIPIRNTFQKMNRLVRDLTSRMNKKVEFKISGEDTEMDRTIVEELGDPLMHMIRNSVDHGVEMPDVRVANGKPAMGTVHLSAYHQGGNIVIEIKDDGAGLRPDKIMAKAVANGIVEPDAQLSEKEIFNLIFAPGFSTAEKVTDISGRGVGMDVVKRNIAKLRGKIEIDSTPGHGSTFKIFLPLTLAIIDGLVVRVGDQRYIIPTLSVRESFRPTKEMISTVHERGEMVNVRGKLRPMLRLYDYFGVEPRTRDASEALVIVVESGHEERCVLVDDLVGKQEVVIKSLGEQFKRNKALAGAAILGDGHVGLILEPRTLVQFDREREAA